MKKISILLILFVFLFSQNIAFAGPTSEDYQLQNYSFGSGGTQTATSEDYGLFGIAGRIDKGSLSSEDFKVLGGLSRTILAHVPPAPTFTNPDNYYNRLRLVINRGDNATDAKYAVAISTDNFASDTRYVQDDGTVGSSLGLEDWRAYDGAGGWGGATGTTIIGLATNTTYTVKVAAKKGDFTETGYGPTAQASTIGATLSFDIDVASTDQETAAPYQLAIGTLTPATVVTSSNRVWVDLSTNATSGGTVYVHGANVGLLSSKTSTTISSVSNDLASVQIGYGARSSSVTQTSGGPMQAVTPYNGTLDTVGILDANKRVIYDSSNQPVSGGRVSFELKAKSSNTTPAADDYTDIITVLVSGAF